jgi:hypothetical protein
MRHRPAEATGERNRGNTGQAENINGAHSREASPTLTGIVGSEEGWQTVGGRAASSKDRPTPKEVRRIPTGSRISDNQKRRKKWFVWPARQGNCRSKTIGMLNGDSTSFQGERIRTKWKDGACAWHKSNPWQPAQARVTGANSKVGDPAVLRGRGRGESAAWRAGTRSRPGAWTGPRGPARPTRWRHAGEETEGRPGLPWVDSSASLTGRVGRRGPEWAPRV